MAQKILPARGGLIVFRSDVLSFYFINDKFEYALYAPDKSKRWALEEYDASDAANVPMPYRVFRLKK